MSISLEKSSSPTDLFRDALPPTLKNCRNTEIWGVDMKHAEGQVLDVILEKFLRSHSANPALQVSRAIASLENTLEWRRFYDPRGLFTEAKSILSDLDLCHITLNEEQYVLWVNIDEINIKAHSAIHSSLTTSDGLVKLGLAVMEKLSTLLLHTAVSYDTHGYSASCVIKFKTHAVQKTRKRHQSFQKKFCSALEELVTLIRHHYPNILGKAYIINARDEYLAHLDIDDALLKNTVLLKNPEELRQYLGSQLPPQYGGTGESFAESDRLRRHCLSREPENSNSLEMPETSPETNDETENTNVKKQTTAFTINPGHTCPEDSKTEEQELRLIYSETIGPPSIVLDPVDLQTAVDLCPGKMGARVVFADSDTVVKFGHGVRLAEAEALHLASTRTTIPVPKLLSAYILDGVGYIVMSYEAGEPLQQYWDHAAKAEQNRILENLRNYVNQMRDISGDFIGGLDSSPCRDGIFEAGYGDYTKYCYGPYSSEERFNEGIIQALRDRLPPKVLAREHDIESNFFNNEYLLYQTVRSMKNHKIVFTHADLHTGNMIVRPDGTVVLLDWGLAGFWPDYWEFYRAMHSPHWRASWDRMVEKFIPPSYIEFSVIERVFGTVWN